MGKYVVASVREVYRSQTRSAPERYILYTVRYYLLQCFGDGCPNTPPSTSTCDTATMPDIGQINIDSSPTLQFRHLALPFS